jgi:hypothetical protein
MEPTGQSAGAVTHTSSTASRALLLYGTLEIPLPPRRLAAGPLTVDLEEGNLRSICFHGIEVIRGIAFLVRSGTWATLSPTIGDLRIRQSVNEFEVSYKARVQDGVQELEYIASISGRGDGHLIFSCEATAITKFTTCRTGFVVLHPIEGVAGHAVRIEHVDGTEVEGRFPALIDPVQPMLDLRALTHEAAPGITVVCRMEGDTFEMEDQRNWTDASFKTYVRPLARPWPYTLTAGERCSQRVAVTISGRPLHRPGSGADIGLEFGLTHGSMPPIGLGCVPAEAAAAMPHMATLRVAGISALVCRFDPRYGHGVADLIRYRDLAAGMNAEVELQLVVPSVDDFAADIAAAAAMVAEARLIPTTVMVVPAADLVSTPPGSPWPSCPPLEAIYRAARSAFPGIRLGGGMFTHFTELNRKRPPVDLLDFITFATTAIVHAADDRSVMETIEALPSMAASARVIAGDLPFVVGPSAIGMRDNPNGPGPLANPRGIRLPMAGRDPRQRGLFNAAWTLGYIAAFALGGAARIAASAPVGDFGILDHEGVWPVYHVLRMCALLRGGDLRAVRSTGGSALAALHVTAAGVSHLLLANLTDTTLRVALPSEFTGAQLAMLDEAALRQGVGATDLLAPSAHRTAAAHITLDSYAVAMLRQTK